MLDLFAMERTFSGPPGTSRCSSAHPVSRTGEGRQTGTPGS